MRIPLLLLATSAQVAIHTLPARADEPDFFDVLPDWSIGGTLHTSVEARGGDGDPGARVFGEEDVEGFTELDLRLSRSFSRFHRWDVSAFIVGDAADVRGRRDGVVLERFRAVGQRGDVATPWRVEIGDYFGFLSERTLQLPLKGGRVELQPTLGDDALFHSIQIYAGNTASDYEAFFRDEADDETHAGASWLAEHADWGALALSGDFSRLDETDAEGAAVSLAGETAFEAAGQSLSFEGEAAFFSGDSDDPTFGDGDGLALLAELTGRSGGWRYSARFEDYDAGYEPPGAAIISDQRFYEARFGHLFEDGAQVEGRLQRQTVDRSSDRSIDTDTAGLFATLPASEATWDARFTFDAFVRDEDSEDGGIDRRSRSAAVTAMRAIDDLWTGTLRLNGVLTRNDGAVVTEDVAFGAVELDVTRRVDFAGFSGAVTPGAQFQAEETSGDTVYGYGPRLGLFLANEDGHSVSLRSDLVFQESGGALVDSIEANAGLIYSYTTGPHRFGVEADYFARDPEGGRSGSAYRFLVSYTLAFDRPARRQDRAGAGFARSGGAPFDTVGFVDLVAFAPGAPIAEAEAALEAAGRTAPFRFGDALVAEDRWLREIDERQRLVLEARLGRLDRAALLVDLPAGGGGPADARTFERVLELFLKRYGPPSVSISEGEFGPDLAARLRDGRFRRIFEWPTDTGVLRLGVPAPLDGRPRIEAVHARAQPAPGQLVWGMQSIR